MYEGYVVEVFRDGEWVVMYEGKEWQQAKTIATVENIFNSIVTLDFWENGIKIQSDIVFESVK